MPSKSEKQRRLMGAVYAAKKDPAKYDKLSPEAKKIYNSMSKEQLRDFAKKGSHSDIYCYYIAKQAFFGRALRSPVTQSMLTKGKDVAKQTQRILPQTTKSIKPPQIKIPTLPKPSVPGARG